MTAREQCSEKGHDFIGPAVVLRQKGDFPFTGYVEIGVVWCRRCGMWTTSHMVEM